MRLGLISDIHANPGPLAEALDLFEARGVEAILCGGDIAGYGEHLSECIELLQRHRVLTVLGNHDLWHCEDWQGAPRDEEVFLRGLPQNLELQFGDLLFHLVHASPLDPLNEGMRLLDIDGVPQLSTCRYWERLLHGYDCDVLMVGHTHQVFARKLGRTLVINPGSSSFNHCCAILDLPQKRVEFFPLGGKKPVLSWNFSMLRRNNSTKEA